ncbi:MAG: hypothetical protein ABH884_00395 [Candidatus Komeilibacteria bacterium]
MNRIETLSVRFNIWLRRFVDSITNVDIAMPFYALWFFLKSVFWGLVIDLVYDALFAALATLKWFGIIIFTNKEPLLIDYVNWHTVTFAIDWPFWIIAFAAGRMSTAMNNILSHLISFVLLGFALSPEIIGYIDLPTFLEAGIVKFAIFGLGAVLAKIKYRKPDRKRRRVSNKGVLGFHYGLRAKKELERTLTIITSLANEINCKITNSSIERVEQGKFRLSGIIIGDVYSLLYLRDTIMTNVGEPLVVNKISKLSEDDNQSRY